jgi:hypothetical protein
MKRLSMLALLIFARTTFAEPTAASSSEPTLAAAEAKPAEAKPAEAKSAEAKPAEPKSPEAKSAVALVSRELVQPLAAKERGRSKFSRARLPPQARRVRAIDEQPQKDAGGRAFVRFAIDARHGFEPIASDEAAWRPATITGCVYLDKGQVFVRNGDQFRPAAFLLGKNVKAAAAGTCEGPSAQLAHAN